MKEEETEQIPAMVLGDSHPTTTAAVHIDKMELDEPNQSHVEEHGQHHNPTEVHETISKDPDDGTDKESDNASDDGDSSGDDSAIPADNAIDIYSLSEGAKGRQLLTKEQLVHLMCRSPAIRKQFKQHYRAEGKIQSRYYPVIFEKQHGEFVHPVQTIRSNVSKWERAYHHWRFPETVTSTGSARQRCQKLLRDERDERDKRGKFRRPDIRRLTASASVSDTLRGHSLDGFDADLTETRATGTLEERLAREQEERLHERAEDRKERERAIAEMQKESRGRRKAEAQIVERDKIIPDYEGIIHGKAAAATTQPEEN